MAQGRGLAGVGVPQAVSLLNQLPDILDLGVDQGVPDVVRHTLVRLKRKQVAEEGQHLVHQL